MWDNVINLAERKEERQAEKAKSGQLGFWDDAPIISSYTRAQAIEDGFLVDLDQFDGARGHFKYPLACTAAVWAIIEKAVNNPKWANDYNGVIHDLCWMSKVHAKALDPTTRLFGVIIRGAGRRSNYTFKIVCGPGDTAEPVLTIMLPEED